MVCSKVFRAKDVEPTAAISSVPSSVRWLVFYQSQNV